MKKRLMAGLIFGVLMFGGVAWAGEYDGVWQTPDYSMYFMIYNTGNTLVFTEIDSAFLTCDVLAGQLTGNIGSVQYLTDSDDSNCRVAINFTSTTTGTYTFTDCSRHSQNTPPVGVAMSMQKLL